MSKEPEGREQSANDITRTGITIALLILFAITAFIVVFRKGIFGYRETGAVDSVRDLPEIGAALGEFEARGPLEFSVFYHPHGSYSFLVCGHASQSQVEQLCKKLDLTCSTTKIGSPGKETSYVGALDDINSALLRSAKATNEKDRFWKGPFLKGDYMITGCNTRVGIVEGAFRKSDGWFMIEVKGRRWLAAPE